MSLVDAGVLHYVTTILNSSMIEERLIDSDSQLNSGTKGTSPLFLILALAKEEETTTETRSAPLQISLIDTKSAYPGFRLILSVSFIRHNERGKERLRRYDRR
jgi:hypothetical protein